MRYAGTRFILFLALVMYFTPRQAVIKSCPKYIIIQILCNRLLLPSSFTLHHFYFVFLHQSFFDRTIHSFFPSLLLRSLPTFIHSHFQKPWSAC